MRKLFVAAAVWAALSGLSVSAHALPGVFAGKSDAKRVNRATHVVLLKRDPVSVVTVVPDYEGPLDPFAFVIPVPADVTLDRVKTVKREVLGRLEELTAPRFNEFYEQDPCDPAPAEQEWQRDLTVKDSGFLGGNQVLGPKKVAPELLLDLTPVFKEGETEYRYTLLDDADSQDPSAALGKRGYKLAAAAVEALKRAAAEGQRLLVVDIDPNRLELGKQERVQLAGVRFWTSQPFTKLRATLGLEHVADKQDLFVYVLHPTERWAPRNYDVVFPPTNIELDDAIQIKNKERIVKERVGEIYNAITDRLLARNPKSFLFEYAWSTEGCGEPCPNEPLLPRELLTLGGDVIEREVVPEAERSPEPPALTDEQTKALEEELKAAPAKERAALKKKWESDRTELARRQALLKRERYTLSRFHHRYDKTTLPHDVELGPASNHVRGGVDVPQGKDAKLPLDVKPADQSRFQVRFNHNYAWDGMMKCEKPERWRWGKRWRHKRVWNKTWVAEDLTAKRRDEMPLEAVVWTPLPALGIKGKVEEPAKADAGAEPAKKSSCDCRVAGAPSGSRAGALAGLLALAVLGARRRR
jgi:MYXO-CTERM domain-containing protein